VVHGTFSPAGRWRPAVVARLARTLAITRTVIEEPPPTLDCAYVIEYAEVDASVTFTGRQALYVDGKLLGAVPRLALCQNFDASDVMMFHCDDEWNVLGSSGGPNLEAARESAERAYAGISAKWIKSRFSREAAKAWLSDSWGEERCAFCGRTPNEVHCLVKGSTGARICDICIAKFGREIDNSSRDG